MGYPVLGYPSFLAFKNGHNAVQILGIFRPDKAQIRRIFRPEHDIRFPMAFSGQFLASLRGIFCPISAQNVFGTKKG